MKRKIRGNKGIGLLELMLSLAIIALLLVAATRYYLTVRLSQQVNEGADMLTAIYSAGQNWLQSNADLSGISVNNFINVGDLPSNFNQANIAPWNGAISVNGAGNFMAVTFSNVPAPICNNLKAKVLAKYPSATSITVCALPSGDLKFTFDMSRS